MKSFTVLNEAIMAFFVLVLACVSVGTSSAWAYSDQESAAGGLDSIVMLILLLGFRAVSWIAKQLDRRVRKQQGAVAQT